MITEGINTDSRHKIYTHSLKPESIDNAQRSSFLEIFNSTAEQYVQDNRPCEYFDLADNLGQTNYKKATFEAKRKQETGDETKELIDLVSSDDK